MANTLKNMNLQVEQLHPLVLNVGKAIHDADWNWKNVSSPFTRLYYVEAGTARIELPNGVHVLSPGYMYFIPAFTKHSNICDSHFVHYYLHIYEEYHLDENWIDQLDIPFEIQASKLDYFLFERLCEINSHMSLKQSDPVTYDNNPTLMKNLLVNKQRTFYDKIESRGIVFQLLSHFFRQAQSKVEIKDQRIRKAVFYIRQHIHENIDLDALVAKSCLSKDHFIRLFKKETGIPPLQYINQRKIEKAQLILVTETLTVKQIAYSLAFEDYSYFNRLFKKITGVTPQQYRYSYQ